MSIQRGIDGSEPLRPEPISSVSGAAELRRTTQSFVVAVGTLACPECDAPVAASSSSEEPLRPAARIGCPYCGRSGAVRDFLTLGEPTRPAHVAVRVRAPMAAWAARGPRGRR